MTPLATGSLLAVAAMTCVGSGIAVSYALVDAPVFTAQAVRYALAAVVLAVLVRVTGRSVGRPRGRQWAWLAGVAATGLVLFNIAVVRGLEHAEPAVLGVAVASVPLLLAVVGPLAAGARPTALVVVAAVVVTAGAAVVQGGGRTDGQGLAWALLVLLTEAAFTLLAVPVLSALGPWSVSLHSCWLAAVGLAVLGAVVEGPSAVARLTGTHLLAVVHLALVLTALAFVLWYSAVGRLGPARAGLFTGVAPVAAAGVGVLVGAGAPGALVWIGIAVVVAGVALGLVRGAPLPRPALAG